MPRHRNRRRLTEAERDARRHADRERIEQAARALLTSDGWQRWIRVRATNGLSRYSLRNQWLIACECHARGITPTYVAGFRAFLALNRCVRKGETAIKILAPVAVKQRDDAGEETGEKRDLLPHRPGLRRLDDRPAPWRRAGPAHAAGAADRRRQPPAPDRPAARPRSRARLPRRDPRAPGRRPRRLVRPQAPADRRRRRPRQPAGPHARSTSSLTRSASATASTGARRPRCSSTASPTSSAPPPGSTSAASRSPTSPAGAKTARSTRSASTRRRSTTIARRIEDALSDGSDASAEQTEQAA